MAKCNVIVTAIGAPGAPDIISLLRKDSQINIIGMDVNEDVAGRYFVNKFARNLHGSDPAFVGHILQTALENDVDVIFPLSTDELLAFSKAREQFEQAGIALCVSDYETIKIANDKASLYRYYQDYDFIPGYQVPSNSEEVEACMHKLGYPANDVCVKPFTSHGSRGFRIITSDSKKLQYSVNARPYNHYIGLDAFLQFTQSVWQPLFFSEYLPGAEWGIDIFVDPQSGESLIATRNNGDVKSSAISLGKLEKKEELIDIGQKIIDQLEFKYIINIDIKYDKDDKPKVIEINPRVPATVRLLSEAGNNLPLISVKRALGIECPLVPVEYGRTVYFYKQSVVV